LSCFEGRGGCQVKNRGVHILQRPFAKAISASEITKDGNSDDIRTTKLSAPRRSRNTHRIETKKALAVGWKLESQ